MVRSMYTSLEQSSVEWISPLGCVLDAKVFAKSGVKGAEWKVRYPWVG